jgi:hypothetical protein
MSIPCGCGGSCGCCQGVEPVTPVAITNRAGLDAIAYRVGTHGRFLETMLARLSHGPLAALRTRDRDDASVAFLDAWATVAEILTFYQERIANEGYLGTATERRSVLELGRLVGYRMHPGVAATTYLAYTLEADAQLTIEPGSKVQSVPQPGELPQTFETTDSTAMRGEWSTLAVRAGRPVDASALGALAGDAEQPLYVKGITTGLAPNDPLLANFGSDQHLYRVIAVQPDSASGRTKVTVTPWQTGSGRQPTSARAAEEPLVAALANLLDEAAAIAPTAPMRDATDVLERLQTNLMLGATGTELRELVEADVLPAVRRARETPGDPLAAAREWFGRVVQRLEPLVTMAGRPPGARPAQVRSIGSLVTSLSKPASVQPASPLELHPSVDATFGSASSVLPELLTTMRPELGGVLYEAWRNLQATPPSALSLYALRVRAAPFGNAAPLEPVKDSKGNITGSREWTLTRRTGTSGPEPFEVALDLPQGSFGSPPPVASITATVGNARAQASMPLSDLLNGTFTLAVTDASEQIQIGLTLPADSPPTDGVLDVSFLQRGTTFRSTLSPGSAGELQASLSWSSEGSDPTQVRFSADVQSDVIGLEAQGGPPLWHVTITGFHDAPGVAPTEDPFVVSLDASYPAATPGGWVVVERPSVSGSPPAAELVISRVTSVRDVSRADYGITGKSTLVGLDKPWLHLGDHGDSFAVIRGSAVFLQSEDLELADVPIDPVDEAVCGSEIGLDRVYDGLEPGRWVIVSGERTDLVPDAQAPETAPAEPGVAGVQAAEVAMIGAVRHDVDPSEPSALTRTTLVLAEPLAYCYRRDTVTIYGNVVKASHGEARQEVLGSGDGTVPNQAFALRQKPLTYVSAATPSGVASTLQVWVDGVRWHEVDTPVGLGPTDRAWVASTADDDTTTVTFGNGVEGARLPSGQENVTAVYRFGIGSVGNVGAGRLTLLATRPTGVKEVTNPQAASGGADREGRDQARRNIPLAVTALDRVVSVQDYADFARTFAGIGKALAARLGDRVHVTIAGDDDIPILATSDLYRNLRRALAEFGDPFEPLDIGVRKLRLLVIVANVGIDPDRRWEDVEPALRAALIDRFGFARRRLAEDLALSEVMTTMQAVPGTVYVDIDVFDTLDEAEVASELTAPSGRGLAHLLGRHERLRAQPPHIVTPPQIEPAELIALTPAVPQTLTILQASA